MRLEPTRVKRRGGRSAATGHPTATASARRAEPPIGGGRLTVVTVSLALLAAAALSTAAADGDRRRIAAEVVLQSSLAVIAAVLAGRSAKRSTPPRAVSPLLVGLGLLTFPLEPLLRAFDIGRAFEVVLIDGLKFASLGLAAASCWPAYRRLAVLMSLFVLLFAASLSTDAAVQVLVAVYAAVGVGWALAAHWEGLRPRLAASQSGGLPKRWLAASALLVLAVLGTAAAGGREAVRSLGGFMPSSGGDGSGFHDPYARDGVGDGDAVVAGTKDVQSFAPIEDAPFLADEKPSLYDVFDDTFEEPYPPPKEQQKSVALANDDLIKRRCEQLAESKQAGREFSTHRKGGRPKAHVADRDSPTLLFVAGRTPLHLRMETFDLFDGVTWYPEPPPESRQPFQAAESSGRTWIVPAVMPRGLDVFRGEESHAVKLVNLRTDRVPAPLHVTGICIDKVPRPDFFAWAEESIPRMDRDSIPPLTVVNVASRTVDPERIAAEARGLGGGAGRFTSLPEGAATDRIAALAREWTRDAARGWPQVEAVTARLRSGYVLDPAAAAPERERLPVGHFLFESRRGPSYQFATAAAVLLRSLGYSTRLVGGFYADPADYDRRLRHTPVLAADAHVWCEVSLGAGVWATVEPTPGYEVLGPPPGLWDRTEASAVAVASFCRENVVVVSLLTAWGLILIRRRRDVADAVATAAWRLRPLRDERAMTLAAVRLLDRRCRRAGLARPSARTPCRWLRQRLRSADEAEQEDLTAFFTAADWAAFAPVGAAPPRNLIAACRAVIASQTLRRLRRDPCPPSARRDGWLRRLLSPVSRPFPA